MKKYYVYLLSCSDKSYYVGVTNDVLHREREHNMGLEKEAYTYSRRPVKVVWYQEFTDPNEAISREKQLKSWDKGQKEALISRTYILPEPSRNAKRKRFDKLDVTNRILKNLPYTDPFLFVDGLERVDKNGAKGHYTFLGDSDFYKGHFKGDPVTPGVLLTECCAQIGLVCLGLFLLNGEAGSRMKIGMSSSEMEFLIPVYPNEKVIVRSEKIYFRFGKLKCKVKMHNQRGELVCKGVLAGMIKTHDDE